MAVSIDVGDLIEYAGNGITVAIYARKIIRAADPRHDRIMDGNVMCYREDVVRVIRTAAELTEGHSRYMAQIRGTASKGG